MCLDEGCVEMGVNDLTKYESIYVTHTSFYRGSAWQWRETWSCVAIECNDAM